MKSRYSRAFSLFLALLLCLSLSPAASAAGSSITVTASEVSYSTEAQTVTVTIAVEPGADITAYGGNVVVPSGWSVEYGEVAIQGKDKRGRDVHEYAPIYPANNNSFNNTYANGMTTTSLEITYNIPAGATGTFTIGVNKLVLSKDGSNQLEGDNNGVTATTTVTITGVSVTPAYAIGTLIVRSDEGTELTAIPAGGFLVTVPVTKTAGEGDCLVFLAAYGESGQFRGLMYVQLEDVPEGATVKVTLPVKNADGGIASLKAFCVASFADLTPLGEAAAFPPPTGNSGGSNETEMGH